MGIQAALRILMDEHHSPETGVLTQSDHNIKPEAIICTGPQIIASGFFRIAVWGLCIESFMYALFHLDFVPDTLNPYASILTAL